MKVKVIERFGGGHSSREADGTMEHVREFVAAVCLNEHAHDWADEGILLATRTQEDGAYHNRPGPDLPVEVCRRPGCGAMRVRQEAREQALNTTHLTSKAAYEKFLVGLAKAEAVINQFGGDEVAAEMTADELQLWKEYAAAAEGGIPLPIQAAMVKAEKRLAEKKGGGREEAGEWILVRDTIPAGCYVGIMGGGLVIAETGIANPGTPVDGIAVQTLKPGDYARPIKDNRCLFERREDKPEVSDEANMVCPHCGCHGAHTAACPKACHYGFLDPKCGYRYDGVNNLAGNITTTDAAKVTCKECQEALHTNAMRRLGLSASLTGVDPAKEGSDRSVVTVVDDGKFRRYTIDGVKGTEMPETLQVAINVTVPRSTCQRCGCQTDESGLGDKDGRRMCGPCREAEATKK